MPPHLPVEPMEEALSLVFFSGDPGSSAPLACLFMAEPGVRKRVGCGHLMRLEGVGSFDILPLLLKRGLKIPYALFQMHISFKIFI